MNVEKQLELQAWMDGELPERDAKRVAECAAKDSEAQSLLAELRLAKGMLAGNDCDAKVTETREFYWNKIEREILRLDREAPCASEPWWTAWRRWLVPAAATATLMALSVITFRPGQPLMDEPFAGLAEVENLSDDTTSLSFRSDKEKVFVVWISNKEQDVMSGPPESSLDEELVD